MTSLMPADFNSGSIPAAKHVYCAATISLVLARIFSSCSRGVIPELSVLSTPSDIRSSSPPTRTMKNSSRLDAVMDRKLILSRSGTLPSDASSRTRWLKSSQLSSRLIRFADLLICRALVLYQDHLHAINPLKHRVFLLERMLFEIKVLVRVDGNNHLPVVQPDIALGTVQGAGRFEGVCNAQDRSQLGDN